MVRKAALEWLAENLVTMAFTRDHPGEPRRYTTTRERIKAALAAAGGE